ncbi:YkvA family protein [Bacillus massilinigeriensis]|uniref:YkvA family protein n=1 Tax=Bacillus mediterraneensis TaxID=1805474 RepID=UPI0009F732F7|nr:YkvA family protein [Bacillus mediterraneensis]
MLGRKRIEKGYRNYIGEAKDYVRDPKKTDRLISAARKKATHRRSSLKDVWKSLSLLIELVRSWRKGEYRKVSVKTIVTIVAALLYFVSPIDIVPDFLIGLGIVDDVAVLGYVLKQVSDELSDYAIWKQERSQIIKSPEIHEES